MGHTLQFIVIAEVLALILGVAVGIYSAIRQYSVFDYMFTTISFLGFAMPTFWLALLLQILFTDIYLNWNVRIFYTSGLNTLPGGDVVAGPAAASRAAGDRRSASSASRCTAASCAPRCST